MTAPVEQQPIPLSLGDLRDYLLYRVPLARVIHDRSVGQFLPRLSGRALELGAGKHHYAALATGTSDYIRSDYTADAGDGRIAIDATDIAFPNASFDSVVCMSTLEHIADYTAALSEMHRILVPGGQLLLCVPWLFPYHGAPDDYHRFSASALHRHLGEFEIDAFVAVGNFWLSQAMMLQRPVWSRPPGDRNARIYDPALRLIGTAFALAGRNQTGPDDNHALLYTCLCRKPLSAVAPDQ